MDLTTSPRAVADRARAIAPGFFTAALIAVAASFVSDTYGGPVMLLALLLGIAFHFLSKGPGTAAGVSFASKTVLRIGVALLGLRIALSDLTALGSETLIIVAVAVAATLGFGVLICRFFEQSRAFGVLIGGATGICGASAALALSGVLGDRLKERETAFAVVSVTMLSTVAMVLYPVFANLIGFSDEVTGIFLGATIHDVAQVVGAGYAVSDEAGDTATIIKLFRVALLMPVLVLVGIAFSTRSAGSVMKGQSPLPWFGVVFFILVGVNSAGILPEGLRLFFVDVSRWCLICAVAAIGLTTSIEEMARLGWRALALPIGTTVAMMLLVIALLLTVGAGA